jgi:hypothetical protein
MIGIIRLAVFGFLALTVTYFLVQLYSRSVRKEKLEKEWDTDPINEGESKHVRDAFIKEGLVKYDHSLRRKLIVLIYIIPTLIFIGTIWVINAQ